MRRIAFEAVNRRMRRTRYGYRQVAKDYQRKIHHIWAIFKYHEYDLRLWADGLEPGDRQERRRVSLEEVENPVRMKLMIIIRKEDKCVDSAKPVIPPATLQSASVTSTNGT